MKIFSILIVNVISQRKLDASLFSIMKRQVAFVIRPRGGAIHNRNENMEMGTRLEMKAFVITVVYPATLFNERQSLFPSFSLRSFV